MTTTRRVGAVAAPASLSESVAETLRGQLVQGLLSAGQRLSEAALSQQLGVSRNTLREAFRILIKEGLLHHEPNRGVSIVVPSISDIIDIYRVRRMIECQAMAQAWPTHPARNQMQAAIDRALLARDARDWRAVASANMAFHAGIVALADSDRLSKLFAHIAAELRLALGMVGDPEHYHAPYVDQNVHLLELFSAGKAAEAAQALERYLTQSERMVLGVYTQKGK